MTIRKEQRDLFTVPQGYYLAHCISGDYALGAGIAKEFNEVYNMREKLHKFYPIEENQKFSNVEKALLIDNVFNLVTKDRSFHKPSYESLEETLWDMYSQIEDKDIKKLAMPLIGCGLDRLDWGTVETMIEYVFNDLDVEILICTL